jgi:hypothetical protein
MSRFTAAWLALREQHDSAARNLDVLKAVTDSLKSAASVHILDLACGSGSTVRALHEQLPSRQHWDLVDNDPDLLGLASKQYLDRDVRLNAVPLDLSRNLEAALGRTIDLITISALLDLVSESWLHQFLNAVAARALPVYAALTYDGRIDLAPSDPLDAEIVLAVNAHQRTDKGFGPALGPSAAGSAIAGFRPLGYSITSGHSDWIIGLDDREMQNELLEGWAKAAHDMQTISGAEIASWLARRKAVLSHGLSSMCVGHVDFFAFPSSTR